MEEFISQNSATLRDYLRVLFRQKAVLITVFITVMVTVIIGLQFQTPVYEAKAKMLISAEKQVDSPYYRAIMGSLRTEASLTQSEIVNSNPVIEKAVRATNLYKRPLNYEKQFASFLKKPFIALQAKALEKRLSRADEKQRQSYLFRLAFEGLRKQIKVEPIRDTNLFTIGVRDYSPVGATILANVLSRAYVIFDLQQQLAEMQLKYGEKHLSVLQLSNNIEKMYKTLNGEPLSDVEAIGPASVKIIEQAVMPLEPSGMPKVITLILAFFMSIFLGIMLAFAFEYLDQSFRSLEDIESVLNIPYLGSIPVKAELKDYRLLADQCILMLKDKNINTVLFSSALAKEGVSKTISNLGAYLSKTAGFKVLLIDANLRNPSLQKIFKLPASQGLVEVLEGKTAFEKAVIGLGNNLFALTAGKEALNPVILFNSHMLSDLLKQVKEKFDVVLIDSAPLNEARDSIALAAHCGGVVLVVNEGKTRRQIVKVAMSALAQNKANVLGAVLNNRTYPIPENIYRRV